MNRVFAIVNEKENQLQFAIELIDNLKGEYEDPIFLFTRRGDVKIENVNVVQIPTSIDNRPKIKNFAIKYFSENNIIGKLHLLEDTVEILTSSKKFVVDIENMMDVYDLHNWLGTITDACNYIYSKYNPRLDISIDREEYKKLRIDGSVFCSHSNVHWIIVDLKKADENEKFFDERFTIDMYWIIEFLARRRNTHPGSLYFMNQYYTCRSERGVYRNRSTISNDDNGKNEQQMKMREEDALFRSICKEFQPDNNIDAVLEILHSKLQSKCS